MRSRLLAVAAVALCGWATAARAGHEDGRVLIVAPPLARADALWMAAGPQASVLTYPVTGEDGAAVLYFMEGWTGIAVAADGRRSTLDEIADAHKDLVEAVRERLDAALPQTS